MAATLTATPPTLRLWMRFVAIAIIAFLYGRATASLAAPDHPTAFWLGNIGAPYVLFPFLAGAWRFGMAGAAAAGGVAGGSSILGFYDVLAVAGNSNSSMELPLDTPDLERIGHAYGRFFGTFLFGQPGGIPWLSMAIVLGVGCGLLGYAWRVHGSRFAGALVVLPFLVEPVVYVVGLNTRIFPGGAYTHEPRNLVIWGAELLVGLILLWWLAVRRRGRDRSSGGVDP